MELCVSKATYFIAVFFRAKNKVIEHLKSKEFIGCLNFCEGGLLAKRKQAKDCDILCLLQCIFLKQKQDRAIPFPTAAV